MSSVTGVELIRVLLPNVLVTRTRLQLANAVKLGTAVS